MEIKRNILTLFLLIFVFKVFSQIPLLGYIQPGSELDTYPVFLTEHGYGTVKQVDAFLDLYSLSPERLALGNLATVSDSNYRIYQLTKMVPMTWEPLLIGGDFLEVDPVYVNDSANLLRKNGVSTLDTAGPLIGTHDMNYTLFYREKNSAGVAIADSLVGIVGLKGIDIMPSITLKPSPIYSLDGIPRAGMLYTNSSNELVFYDGTQWYNLLASGGNPVLADVNVNDTTRWGNNNDWTFEGSDFFRDEILNGNTGAQVVKSDATYDVGLSLSATANDKVVLYDFNKSTYEFSIFNLDEWAVNSSDNNITRLFDMYSWAANDKSIKLGDKLVPFDGIIVDGDGHPMNYLADYSSNFTGLSLVNDSYMRQAISDSLSSKPIMTDSSIVFHQLSSTGIQLSSVPNQETGSESISIVPYNSSNYGAPGTKSVAIGVWASAKGDRGVAIGKQAYISEGSRGSINISEQGGIGADSDGCVNIGRYPTIESNVTNSICIGEYSRISSGSINSTALDGTIDDNVRAGFAFRGNVKKSWSVAIGDRVIVDGENSFGAMGPGVVTGTIYNYIRSDHSIGIQRVTSTKYQDGDYSTVLGGLNNVISSSATGAVILGGNTTTATQPWTTYIEAALRLKPQSSAPSSPEEGTIYFDDTTKKLRCWDGTQWNDLW